MIEERKKREIDHYNNEYRGADSRALKYHTEGDEGKLRPLIKRLYQLMNLYVTGKEVLDFCCGDGVHAVPMAKMGSKKILAIDLSEESLKAAQKRFDGEKKYDIEFKVMDAEKLAIADASFDVVFDGGAFSSLDLPKALKEIHRVLKPGGVLIGVETLGHNPFMNFNRARNVKNGKRTEWAQNHIVKMKDFRLMKEYFNPVHHEFWELTALVGHALKSPLLIEMGTVVDALLLRIPLLKRWAFKTIFVYQKPCSKD